MFLGGEEEACVRLPFLLSLLINDELASAED